MTEPEKNYGKSMNAARCKISEWHSQHKKDYAKFKDAIDKADNGDYTIYYKIFELATEFIPQLVLWQSEKLFAKTSKNAEATRESATDKDKLKETTLQIFEDDFSEYSKMKGYFRIGIESCEEIARQKSLSDEEKTMITFGDITNEDNADSDNGYDEFFSHLAISNVEEKDDTDKLHYYMRIKNGEELWSGLPVVLRLGLPLFFGKSAKELGDCFCRIILAFVITAGDMYEWMLRRMSKDKDSDLLHCILYYVSLDGGLVHSAKHLSKLFHSHKAICQLMSFAPTIISNMTKTSVKYGHDKKSDWAELKDDNDDEISTEVTHALADTKAKRGRRMIETETFNLDDMLVGDKEAIKKLIISYRETYPDITHMSYLLIILQASGCVDTDLPYPHFHHAMEAFEGKKMNIDRVSRMYYYMKCNHKEFEESHLPKWYLGRMIIHNWQKSFDKLSTK